jgi:hypothetical protein
MPLLFYGRLNDGKRRLYSPDLRPIESSVFDNYMVKHLAHMEALEIMRTSFPDYLVPGAIVFRFNNQDGAYRYHD